MSVSRWADSFTYDGYQRNEPVVRFGSISMMPTRLSSREGLSQLSYLVEVRSLPGSSGAPVFVYKKPFTPRPKGPQLGAWGPFLLGIDWCHLQQRSAVYESDGEPGTGGIVYENTGMMGVVPAWKLIEMLDLPEVIAVTDEAKKQIDGERKEATVAPDTGESADEP